MKSGLVIQAVVVLSLLAGGCASERQRAQEALPSSIPVTVEGWNGGTLAKVEFIKSFKTSDYSAVQIFPADTKSVVLPTADDNSHAAVVLTLAKTSEVFSLTMPEKLSEIIPVVMSTSAPPVTGRTLQIHLKVLEMDPGSASLRMWVGRGAGGTVTHISGDITDSQTGTALLRFEHTQNNRGSGHYDDYDLLLQEDVQAIAGNVGILLEAFSPPEKK